MKKITTWTLFLRAALARINGRTRIGGAGGADDARHGGAEYENAGVHQRAAAQGAGDQYAAGHHIEREQQDDEAHIFGEHGVHEGRERARCAEGDGERRQREQRPRCCDLAVMGVPEFREQQRAGGDAQKDAGKREGPGPAHLCAVKIGGVGGGGEQDSGHSERETADHSGTLMTEKVTLA
jgi:hypothetical protein